MVISQKLHDFFHLLAQEFNVNYLYSPDFPFNLNGIKSHDLDSELTSSYLEINAPLNLPSIIQLFH